MDNEVTLKSWLIVVKLQNTAKSNAIFLKSGGAKFYPKLVFEFTFL